MFKQRGSVNSKRTFTGRPWLFSKEVLFPGTTSDTEQESNQG